MKISIIIPVYHNVNFLSDCLDSICSASPEEIEVIIVDDEIQNKEELKQVVAKRAKDISIRVVSLREKTGVAAARNLGVQEAKGDYLLFLDDDDYLVPEAMDVYLREAKEADVIAFEMERSRIGRQTYLMELEKQEEGEAHKEWKETGESPAARLVRDKEKLSQISMLNILFRRNFITKNRIICNEEYKYYSDLPFMIQAIENLSTFRYLPVLTYQKRTHNDPVQAPSLSQRKDRERTKQYLMAYEEAKRMAKDKLLTFYLEQKLIRYFVDTFSVHMRRREEESFRNEWFDQVKLLLSECSKESLEEQSRYGRRIVKTAVKGKKKNVLFRVTAHLAARKAKQMIKKKNVFCKTIYIHLFYRQKVKENYILFESFLGRGYSDSPKYIYEYLNQKEPGRYKCIWVFRGRKKDIPYGAVRVKRFGILYAYYLAVSKYFVFNMRQPLFMKVKPEQVFVETWHGIPMKRLIFDQPEVTGPNKHYKENAYKESRQWDYLISPNHYCTEILRSCFLYENKIIETGYPRNDILHIEEDSLVEKIRTRLGIPENKEILLYAPTFRDNEYYKIGEYKCNLAIDLAYMREKLQEEYVLLVRTHYLISDRLDLTGLTDFVINVSDYDDIQELYLIADVLISDYSSVAFDYANLKRPMIFYTYDLEQYRENLRGFYIDIEKELPGPMVFSTSELVEAILNIEEVKNKYKERYDLFYKKYCYLEDGYSTKRVVEQIF